MLLPLNKLGCWSDLLRATNLAGEILRYAETWPRRTFDKDDFKKSVTLGPFLARKSALVKHIEALLALPRSERTLLRQAFEHDIEFYNHIDDANYSFKCRTLNVATFKAGKALLVYFYKSILASKKGFEGLTSSTTALNTSAVETSYRISNPNSKSICPACLGDLKAPVKKVSLVDRDHFFPKAIYFPLAVHPANLALVCMECNERIKKEADPIAVPAPGELRTTWIPYSRHGLDEITLMINLGTPTPTVEIQGSTVEARLRAKNFDRIFKLSQQWGNALESSHISVMCYLASHLEATRPITLVNLNDQLQVYERKCQLTKTRVSRAYLDGQYASWLRAHRLKETLIELQGMLAVP